MTAADAFWLILAVLGACLKLSILLIYFLMKAVWEIMAGWLVFLFQNWVLQTLFAAWLAFALQQVHQKSVRRNELYQLRYEQKISAIQIFFGLLDKRTYATRTYLGALRETGDAWRVERENYRLVVREWNEKAPSTLVTLLTLLPARLCFQLERETFLPFAEMDTYLGRIRRAREVNNIDYVRVAEVQELLESVSAQSSLALAEFLNLTREERKLISQQPTISQDNIKNLSLGYLITSLFKPSINR